ncbi:MAG: pirin-like C-terminal cupin domain-containing protein [Actinomycetota bacterium]
MTDQTTTIRSIRSVTAHDRIDGVVPGVRGQRALPTHGLGMVDPFVMLDHIGPQTLHEGFYVDGHMHPHRGFETITMMFEGVMHHVDTAGFRETLSTGSTQNMVAGSGIQHGGDMAADPDTNTFHEVQLWINTPAAAKMNPPAISSAHVGEKPILDLGHATIEVITGELHGHRSPLQTTQPTTVLRVQSFGTGSTTVEELDATWNVVAYMLQGAAVINGRTVSQFDTVLFDRAAGAISIDTDDEPADILLLAGKPIGEPVVLGGPFVMNTQAEIDQAHADFAAGRFDRVELASSPDPKPASKRILARACDPLMAARAASAIPELLGGPDYVAATDDDDFIDRLRNEQWSIVYFAPGACRFSAAGAAIPGGNAATAGWTLDDYRALVHETQGPDIAIVEAFDESETVPALRTALATAAPV